MGNSPRPRWAILLVFAACDLSATRFTDEFHPSRCGVVAECIGLDHTKEVWTLPHMAPFQYCRTFDEGSELYVSNPLFEPVCSSEGFSFVPSKGRECLDCLATITCDEVWEQMAQVADFTGRFCPVCVEVCDYDSGVDGGGTCPYGFTCMTITI